MASKYKSRGVGIFTYILLILAIVAAVGVVFRFTGGFTSDFSTFYVTVDGKDIMTASGGYTASQSEPLRVDVHYAFSSGDNEPQGYSVKVIPHKTENRDFDFTLDGISYAYSEEDDLTKGFDIEYGESSFKVKPKGGLSDIFEAVYPNYTVGECEEYAYEDMFTLVITSYNGKASVSLHFGIIPGAGKIKLNQTEICF